MNKHTYIANKLAHLKRIGVSADIDPQNGAVRTAYVKTEQEDREKRLKRLKKSTSVSSD
jgi:hypothetical protein